MTLSNMSIIVDIENLQSDNTSSKTRITNLESDNTTNKNNISNLQSDNTINKTDIDNIESEILNARKGKSKLVDKINLIDLLLGKVGLGTVSDVDNGYAKIPLKINETDTPIILILQWGRIDFNATGTVRNFPIPFTKNVFTLQGMPENDTKIWVESTSLAQFSFGLNQYAQVRWFAIGV